MNYYLNLFSPETAKVFSESDKLISGFRMSRKSHVDNRSIGSGDRFVCYISRIQRFVGILEIKIRFFSNIYQRE